MGNSKRDYAAVQVDQWLEDDCRQLVRLAVREDLDRGADWTTLCLIDTELTGECAIVARAAGVCAGLVTLPWLVDEMEADLAIDPHLADGQPLESGQRLATLRGNARDLLTCERPILNLLGRLCGIATCTRKYVDAIRQTAARVYDTRKTTPGWRRLEKYAVRVGGGHNHRTGLFDGFLVKDNHLALGRLSAGQAAAAVRRWAGGQCDGIPLPEIVEVEVDSLQQLPELLEAAPDIVLLDNFSLHDLGRAVAIRDAIAPQVELEASGNIRLDTIRPIAQTGVERISSGALTHRATWLDLGMDWSGENAS